MKIIFVCLMFFFVSGGLKAQNVTINPSGIIPSGAYPRISYDEIMALPNPKAGDIAYDLTFNVLRLYTGVKWIYVFQDPGHPTETKFGILATGGSSLGDSSYAIAVDNNFVYVAGNFRGTAQFGGTSKTSSGGTDVFIVKYNKAGILQWVISAGGTEDEICNDIGIDNSNNLYITGNFKGTTAFGSFNATSAGSIDLFTAKLNLTSVTWSWLKSFGGNEADKGQSIKVDGVGNIYLTGSYSETVDFNGHLLTSHGGSDVFIAKLNTSGNIEWVKSGGGIDTDFGKTITYDSNRNIYVIGSFTNSAIFDSFTLTGLDNEVFVIKYDSIGVIQWVKSSGGSGKDIGNGITVDISGNVYITGNYENTFTFGEFSKTSFGNTDIFIAKYDENGSEMWLNSTGYPNDADEGNAITLGTDGKIYVVGKVSILYMGVFDNDGNLQHLRQSGSGAKDIAIDNSGNIFITGNFINSIEFDYTTATSLGSSDFYLVRYSK